MEFGKWLGGGLGWVLGGPIGGVMGFVFGSMLDSMNSGQYEYHPDEPQTTREGDFNLSLLVLAASVMRADGKVMQSELNFVRQVLSRQFGQKKAEQQILVLREILKKEYSLRQVCLQIQMNMPHPARLQLMHFLFGIATADGHFHEGEKSVIDLIGRYLNISPSDLESIRAMFVKSGENAYKVLEISPDASDEDVRKAYRKMAMKYHPDKVENLGEDVSSAAKEKFQSLQRAYDQIRKQRGMK